MQLHNRIIQKKTTTASVPSPEIMGIFSEVNPAACDNTTTKAAVKRIRSR